MFVLLVSYLLLVFVVPVALSAAVSYRSLPVGRACPSCGGDSLPIVDVRLRAVSRLDPLTLLQRRWCLCCGWEGTVRLPRRRPRPAAGAPAEADVPVTGAVADGHSRAGRGDDGGGRPDAAGGEQPASTQTLDVRSLTIDGLSWRVMLQCWHQTGQCYGRLIFIAPSGRLWLDAVEPFHGSDEREVLGRARLLPDGLLTNRLRRLVGEW